MPSLVEIGPVVVEKKKKSLHTEGQLTTGVKKCSVEFKSHQEFHLY